MPVKYQIVVRSMDEHFVVYTADDMDEAQGQADFCRAEMPGAKVSIERIEWIPDEDR